MDSDVASASTDNALDVEALACGLVEVYKWNRVRATLEVWLGERAHLSLALLGGL